MTERRTPLKIRNVEYPSALVGFARLAFVVLLLALGVSVIRCSLGDLSSEADPALSIVIDPTQASARVAVSERLMANSSKIADAVAGAREALRHNPLLPEALTLLAWGGSRLAETSGCGN
jgi:cytochrome c-type biogenesis protein CcmH/NrfG